MIDIMSKSNHCQLWINEDFGIQFGPELALADYDTADIPNAATIAANISQLP